MDLGFDNGIIVIILNPMNSFAQNACIEFNNCLLYLSNESISASTRKFVVGLAVVSFCLYFLAHGIIL